MVDVKLAHFENCTMLHIFHLKQNIRSIALLAIEKYGPNLIFNTDFVKKWPGDWFMDVCFYIQKVCLERGGNLVLCVTNSVVKDKVEELDPNEKIPVFYQYWKSIDYFSQ